VYYGFHYSYYYNFFIKLAVAKKQLEMAGHSEKVDSATLWGGGGSPFRLSYGKQWMWFFLVSDALTFGGLLCTMDIFVTNMAIGRLEKKYLMQCHF